MQSHSTSKRFLGASIRLAKPFWDTLGLAFNHIPDSWQLLILLPLSVGLSIPFPVCIRGDTCSVCLCHFLKSIFSDQIQATVYLI